MKKNNTQPMPEKTHVPRWLQLELSEKAAPFVNKMIEAYQKENLGWTRFALHTLAEQCACIGYFHADPNPPEEKATQPTAHEQGKELPKLIKWHNANYPPLDLSEPLPLIRELIKAYLELQHENEVQKHNYNTGCLLSLEFGYKQCEKGENLDAAFINFAEIKNNRK